MHHWLVVSNIFYVSICFHNIWDHHPNWRPHIFQRVGQPPTCPKVSLRSAKAKGKNSKGDKGAMRHAGHQSGLAVFFHCKCPLKWNIQKPSKPPSKLAAIAAIAVFCGVRKSVYCGSCHSQSFKLSLLEISSGTCPKERMRSSRGRPCRFVLFPLSLMIGAMGLTIWLWLTYPWKITIFKYF